MLHSLDVDDCAVDQLHEFPEHRVRVLVNLLEEHALFVCEGRVSLAIVMGSDEDVPLTHCFVG